MSHIEWDESFCIDKAEIDEQHRKWIEIHNRLHTILLEGNVDSLQGAAIETLQDMQAYTRQHFAFEEAYMARLGFTGAREHWRLHKDFDNLVYSYLREAQNGNMPILNSELVKVLKNWLIHHILVEDRKFSPLAKKE